MKFKLRSVLLSLLSVNTMASANVIINGSFETPTVISFNNYPTTNSKYITGWTVVGTRVQFIDGNFAAGYRASDGRQWVNITGVVGYGQGLRSDPFPTIIGDMYNISFDLAGRYGYGNSSARVSINEHPIGIFTSIYNNLAVQMDWEAHTFNWIADATSSQITILAANVPGFSNTSTMGLDNVRVEDVTPSPDLTKISEPSSIGLMGLGLISLLLLRRSTKS